MRNLIDIAGSEAEAWCGTKGESPAASNGYAKMPAIPGSTLLSMDTVIAVGFGSAMLTRNGKPVWAETTDYEYNECLTAKQAETMAAFYPEDDWRISLVGPLSEVYYQRQGKGQWVIYEKGEGFA